LKGATSVTILVDSTRKDGKVLKLEGVGTLLRKENGDPEVFFISFIDVTDKFRVEKELTLTSGNYDSLFSNSDNGIILFDVQKEKNLDCNDAVLEILGLNKDKVLSTKLRDIVPQFSTYFPQEDQQEQFTKRVDSIKVGQFEKTGLMLKKNHLSMRL